MGHLKKLMPVYAAKLAQYLGIWTFHVSDETRTMGRKILHLLIVITGTKRSQIYVI